MVKKYYIIYNPLTFSLMDHLGKCATPLDMLSILTGLDASTLDEKNFTDFLTFDLSKQREGLLEMLAIENYALIYLANQLSKSDPPAKIILADGKRRTLSEIIKGEGCSPGAVLVTSISANFPAAAAAAIVLNHAKIPVVIGGIHVSNSPEDVDTFIRKYVPYPELVSHVRGPGDSHMMKQLVEDLKKHSLKQEYLGYETIEDGMWGQDNIIYMPPMKMALLKKIPIVGRWVMKRFVINGITPYLGCPYCCSFCSISTLPRNQKKFKARSPGDFIAELEHYQQDGINSKNRIYYFLSDNLILGGKKLEEILDKIIDSDLTVNFAAQVSIDIAIRDELLDKLRLAGATHFIIGLESLDLRNLESIGKSIVKDIKKSGLSVKEYYAKLIKKIQDRGISVHSAFIFGLPYDYFHSFEDNTAVEVIDFCIKNHIGIQPACLTDLPGSPNYKKSLEKGTFLYGQPGSMDYLLSLCTADLSEGNRPVSSSLKNSPLTVVYMVYEAAQKVGAPLTAWRNAFFMSKRSWWFTTKNGRKSLAGRLYETFLSFCNQWINSLYREGFQAVAYSRETAPAADNNRLRGTFERLYDREQNPEVRAMFEDYVEQFKHRRAGKFFR